MRKLEESESQVQVQSGVEKFFSRSKDACNPFDFPDVSKSEESFGSKSEKLRGGCSYPHVVAIKSDSSKLNSALSLFRDMNKVCVITNQVASTVCLEVYH